MERWALRDRVCAVERFVRTGSITETQRKFRPEPKQQEAPSLNAICRWVRQWRGEGSVKRKEPPGRPPSVHTPDNFQIKHFKPLCAAS
jgi:transposase